VGLCHGRYEELKNVQNIDDWRFRVKLGRDSAAAADIY